MAMTIRQMIDGLMADVKAGIYNEDDVLVVDWFSYHDVEQRILDMEDENIPTQERLKEIWAKCVEQIDYELDEFHTSEINNLITEVVEGEIANG